MLASGAADNTVKLWDVATHANIATLEGHTDVIWSVAFSLDGTMLASGAADNTVKLWDVATHANIATLEGHTDVIWSVAFSPDGTMLASGQRIIRSSCGTWKRTRYRHPQRAYGCDLVDSVFRLMGRCSLPGSG